jgi:hypothetical protein
VKDELKQGQLKLFRGSMEEISKKKLHIKLLQKKKLYIHEMKILNWKR